ncbi:hypothetical protein H2199_002717 [Coniosporium tulheliwenetii]|uniref:Uncharacterized protein n=1 Tax=Coniosporium tulheliwenetii TaxID=3383036 RepID=A0ACC2ZEN0_9PEZI|nr:hypothetical protein H2199_002717 [Cladosporium sp. JES 115]
MAPPTSPSSAAEIEACLSGRIPLQPREAFDEGVFLEISDYLGSLPQHKKWSKNPRLYTLLRLVVGHGRTSHSVFEAFAGLLPYDPRDLNISDQKYADYAIPLSEPYLPEEIRQDETLLDRLKELQPLVLSPTSSMQEDSFMGSFTDRRFFALLLSPIADGDLWSWLKKQNSKAQALPDDEITQLKTFFGCLATAVLYLHSNGALHGDLKSKNVLHKAGKVLLCDFGVSRDYLASDESTHFTNITPRYSAPEVVAPEAEGRRERKNPSDIFSLGCVFLEILTVIRGSTLDAMNKHLKEETKEEDQYSLPLHRVLPKVASWLNELQAAEPDPGLIPMIRGMLRSFGIL